MNQVDILLHTVGISHCNHACLTSTYIFVLIVINLHLTHLGVLLLFLLYILNNMQDEDSKDSVYTFLLNEVEEVMNMPRYEPYDEKTQQLIMDEYVSHV